MNKRLRKVLYFLTFVVIIGIIIFISRGPYISNALKRIILPELETASGQRVIAQKIYINIFPLFIEAKGLKVFDENGNRILFANRVKGYLEPSGLLDRHLSIRRLVINNPDISTNSEQLELVIKSVKAYLEKERRRVLKVRVKAIDVTNGAASFRDDGLKSTMGIRGLEGEIILGEAPRLKTSIKEFAIKREGWPEFRCDIDTALVFRDDGVKIKSLNIGSYGSEFKGTGFYSKGKGILMTDIALLVDSVKRIFNLKQRGEGRISAKGEIRLERISNFEFRISNLKNIFINLKLKGDFYIQTLMELLRVKEKVEGLVDFQGEIKGQLSDISGKAKARLGKGNLFDVEIDSLRCEVLYDSGVMRFKNGIAELYNGRAQADASLNLPAAESFTPTPLEKATAVKVWGFTLNVKFNSIDSSAALKLIGWEPEIPAGKVDGELVTSGNKFNPDGWFVYEALSKEQRAEGKDHLLADNVLRRIKNIKGNYSLRDDILYLTGVKLSTTLSNLNVEGRINILEEALDLKCRLDTDEVSDLILPYYSKLKGRGDFSGEITGTFDNPEISGKANISNASIEGYRADSITSDFSYNKSLLNIQEIVVISAGGEQRIKGKISFPRAEKLFELSMPVYEMNASIKNSGLRDAIQIFYKDLLATGRLNADFRIGGKDKGIEIAGNALIEKALVYKIPIDSVSAAFSYANKELSFKQAIIRRGTSTLTAEGKISSDEKFSFRASSDRVQIKDIGLENIPVDAFLSIQSEGQGTFKEPAITLNAKVVEGVFRGRSLGSGIINAAIKNKNILLDVSLFDEKLKLRGEGHLDDKLPWTAEADIQPGRYDFILGSILKEVPEDLLLNLRGHVEMKGDRKHITASANVNYLMLSLFGYSFSNDSDIKIQVDNRKLSFLAFNIRNGGTSFKLRGGIEIGREYDIHLEGKSSLSPLKGLSKKIGHLKGDADFVFSITGKWEKPEINGDMNISNASFGLKDYYTYISSINGYLNIDKDRIVVQRLSGKIGGGDIDISGLVYLKAFSIKGFYMDANLDNISTSISKDFGLNFGGNLLYKGTLDSQSIIGDIKIKRSRYRKRVEWKSWLLMAKEKPKAEVSRFGGAALNIRISGSDNIYIDNNIARAPLKVDAVLRGTISRPILFGRLESIGGSVYFRNNEFRIIHASA
ncbi:MAG: translocation/assembly module TamB domain-containing protein, partial [Nitrospirota bacterium]